MSKFVKIKTELRDLALIKRSLDDLKIEYSEEARQYVHRWTDTRVPTQLNIRDGYATFGLRADEEGVYEVVGDDMQLSRMKRTIDRMQQRYAYHKVLAETEAAGFSLVEEQVGADNVIRMTVRRWQ